MLENNEYWAECLSLMKEKGYEEVECKVLFKNYQDYMDKLLGEHSYIIYHDWPSIVVEEIIKNLKKYS